MKKIFLLFVTVIISLLLICCQQNGINNKINIGQTVNSGKFEISFDGAEEFKMLKSDNKYIKDDKANPGKVFIAMYFEIKNLSDKDDGINTFTDVDCYVDDSKAEEKALFNQPNKDYQNLFGLIYVAPGRKSKQCIIFEADENWENADLEYKEAFNKDSKRIVFTINKKNIENKANKQTNVSQTKAYMSQSYIVNIGGYDFLIPDYFKEEEISKKDTFYASTKGENQAFVMILYTKSDKEKLTFELLEKKTEEGEMQNLVSTMFKEFAITESNFINHEKVINNNIKGYIYNYNVKILNKNCVTKALCYLDEEDNSMFFVILIDANNYYETAFNEIVSQIKKSK